MTTEKQTAANQANAKKSTGPKNTPGKDKAKFNARRHGLTGQFCCMSEDDETAFFKFRDKMLLDLKPAGAYESQLAITIIQSHWSINRAQGIEHNIFAHGNDMLYDTVSASTPQVHAGVTMVRTWLKDDRLFTNIALYITRLNRLIANTEKRLNALKDERTNAEAQAKREAELLLRLALMKGDTPEQVGLTTTKSEENGKSEVQIHTNGFVFSLPELTRLINRKQALAEAEHYEKNGWEPLNPHPISQSKLPKRA